MKLQLDLKVVGDTAEIEVIGIVDEDSDFSKIESLKQPNISFNFDKLKGINSCGIREWINFLNKLDSSMNITYEKCPQALVEQMGMVKGFLKGNCKISSYYAPYFCESCDEEVKVLLTDVGPKTLAPKEKCPTCSSDLEFDAIEAQYFSFLK